MKYVFTLSMKHIRRFLESTDEGNLDILEYFFDLDGNFKISIKEISIFYETH